MPCTEIEAKSITRLRGTVDPWFLARYGMNLYRGCEHACAYCDGRSERYYVEGDFERDIVVKRNAVEVLDRELRRRREPGFLCVGGGVSDSYQPAEARYCLVRGVLELARTHGLPVHVLTKSALVERDFDLLADIQARSQVVLSFSLQTVDDDVRARFEPGAATVGDRLRLMRRAKELGFTVGAMAMPVLPGISDTGDAIGTLVRTVADAGADFVCYGALTLRPGVQKDTYLAVIAQQYANLLDGYTRVYALARSSGAPHPRYAERVDSRFCAALRRHRIPSRIPRRAFSGRVPLYAEIGVLLEHEDAARRVTGEPQLGLSRAGWAIQTWAAQRLSRLGRKKGFHCGQVEDELRTALKSDDELARAGLKLYGAALELARSYMRELGSYAVPP